MTPTIYSADDTNFRERVHPKLRRRIRIFLTIGGIMFLLVVYDLWSESLSLTLAGVSIIIGALVGVVSSRIFHLSWDHDGQHVVSQIDGIGWAVLGLYIIFEIGRSVFFTEFFHTNYSATAITFAFVSAALIARVFGLRGRIIDILRQERIFG